MKLSHDGRVQPEWDDQDERDGEGPDGEGREGDQRHVVCDVALSCDPSQCMVSTVPKSSTDNQLDKASRYRDESNKRIQQQIFTNSYKAPNSITK